MVCNWINDELQTHIIITFHRLVVVLFVFVDGLFNYQLMLCGAESHVKIV